MVADLTKYKSHPHKELTVHTQGVLDKTMALTNMEIAEIAAIFHDLGKMNPNFQDKLDKTKTAKGYGNHAYLSAYGFFCFVKNNMEYLKQKLGGDIHSQNKMIAIIAIIAKHHGNLPNFETIVTEDECNRLFDFINQNPVIPSTEFIRHFVPEIKDFELTNKAAFQETFRKRLSYKSNEENLAHFLDTQFAFASLIQSDKTDAGDLDLQQDREKVHVFCNSYNQKLNHYLQSLQPNSELNILRTTIRVAATEKIQGLLKATKQRVFALTAPTGAGKTLMLLSLANEIIKEKGDYRILYTIPFLSITEQVESECLKIFGSEFIHRIDSKAGNEAFERLQKEVETNPEKAKDIMKANFIENIFLSPFIITTFVRFFETLVSNVNATLLKLPSFSKCIFLIDEIQSLPPRLYAFFVAYIAAFCEKFDAYCIVSTATMPNFLLPQNSDESKNPKLLFKNFTVPEELSSLHYFNHQLFNRYTIHKQNNEVDIEQLSQMIIGEKQSVLVILNTIDDTKDLYNRLLADFDRTELILLNTHFTPNDRKYKIDYAKLRLAYKQRIILISTQLIEAGVDIDFPILYRDMATIPSIIQSAGRCNRNGKLVSGKIVLLNLINRDKNRAELIYRGKDKKLLTETRRYLTQVNYSESSLFDVQKGFFTFLGTNLMFGEHVQKKPLAEINFVKHINEMAFDTIGKFRLIDEDFYGEEFRCYIPIDERDNAFDELIRLDEMFKRYCNVPKELKDFKQIMSAKFAVETHLKKMSNQIIQIHLKKDEIKPLSLGNYNELHIVDLASYSRETGIILDVENQFI